MYKRLHTHYAVNSGAFDSLTEDTAYVLGFVLADGSIYHDRLKISNNNLDVLVAIRLALKSDHRIVPASALRDRSYSIYIRNRALTDGLRAWGLCENKSLRGSWPEHIPDHLVGSVLRGYFDGDGHVNYTLRGGLQLKFTAGSRALLQRLTAKLHELYDLPLRRIKNDEGRPHAMRLLYFGESAATLGRAMYANAGIHIPRKRVPFVSYANRRYAVARTSATPSAPIMRTGAMAVSPTVPATGE